jgi:hypothetical protein
MKIESAYLQDLKMVDIGKHVIDLRRKVAIEKSTRHRRPLKRLLTSNSYH